MYVFKCVNPNKTSPNFKSIAASISADDANDKRKLRNKLQFVGSGKYKYNIKCSIIIITSVCSSQQNLL